MVKTESEMIQEHLRKMDEEDRQEIVNRKNVAQIIAELQTFDGDALVWVEGCDCVLGAMSVELMNHQEYPGNAVVIRNVEKSGR